MNDIEYWVCAVCKISCRSSVASGEKWVKCKFCTL